MIERYGFYEGKGTSYRVSPKMIIDVLRAERSTQAGGHQRLPFEPANDQELKTRRVGTLGSDRIDRVGPVACGCYGCSPDRTFKTYELEETQPVRHENNSEQHAGDRESNQPH